jgi:chaperone modulatory protein CbpM
MTSNEIHELVEGMQEWSLLELCQRHLLDADFIVACVESGIIEAGGLAATMPQAEWRFSAAAVLRIEKARRLQRDLELGLGEMVLVLDLLDEVESLRAEVSSLRKRLQHWEHSS